MNTLPPSETVSRRRFVKNTSLALAAATLAPLGAFSPAPVRRMGLAISSYALRWGSKTESRQYPGFTHALEVLEHCHSLGAGGIQIGLRNWTADFAGKVRDRREQLDMYLEGQIQLPKSETDIARFETEIRHAREAGASLVRTACLSGRRYETFETLRAWQDFQAASMQSLEWAEPACRKNKVLLAVENHKDWRIQEMLDLLKRFDSEWIGVTLDLGNNISLLEDPMEVVQRLAPYALTTHFKDMAVAEYEDGFLLSEVPLGQGFLDLAAMKALCEQHRPGMTHNLEMITRDPLRVPCLRERYWETLAEVRASELAHTLMTVKKQQKSATLPGITGLDPEQRLAFEEENIRASFAYARELGFD